MLDVSRWQLTDKGTELPMLAEEDVTVLLLASNVRFWGTRLVIFQSHTESHSGGSGGQ